MNTYDWDKTNLFPTALAFKTQKTYFCCIKKQQHLVWPHKADFILKIRHSKKNSIKQMPSTWLTIILKNEFFNVEVSNVYQQKPSGQFQRVSVFVMYGIQYFKMYEKYDHEEICLSCFSQNIKPLGVLFSLAFSRAHRNSWAGKAVNGNVGTLCGLPYWRASSTQPLLGSKLWNLQRNTGAMCQIFW